MMFNPKRSADVRKKFRVRDNFTSEVISRHFNDAEISEVDDLLNYNRKAVETQHLSRVATMQVLFKVAPYPGCNPHVVCVQLSGHDVVAVEVDGTAFVGYVSDALFSVLD